jgi:hypothetical protein
MIIRDSLNGEFENVELSRTTSELLIEALYDAFEEFKLTGPIAEPENEERLISLQDCKDYSDDFLYDEQQYRQYFSKKTWEQFNLSDAAIMLGYLHILPKRVRYSAFPFMAEVILRADRWVNAFTNFVSRLRDDFKTPNYASVECFYDGSTKKTILAFLDITKAKAQENAKYEMVTVIERAMRDLNKII